MTECGLEELSAVVQEIDDLRFQLSPHAKFDFRAAVLLVHDNQVLVTVQPLVVLPLSPGVQ